MAAKALQIIADRLQAAPPTLVWEQPAVIAALIAASVAILSILAGVMGNFFLQRQRLKFDERLAQRRFDFDKNLAERKIELDRQLDDWKRKAQFAEASLSDFYEARSRMQEIRSPASFSSENDDRQGREGEAEGVRQIRDTYYPILRRIMNASEFFNTFYSKRYRAQALFGAHADQPYARMWGALHRTRVAAGMLMREDMHVQHPNVDQTRERMSEVIWEGLAENDPVAAEVEAAVAAAEALFQPTIAGIPKDGGN